ncbi:EVE domain-containing protein [Candidatus Acidianus copahuensis]|uniref:EVE domain-containing protein n=1 Tax=Candidatus Acidianus copahuensis TaxID=1160895 RepID=A0A031LKL1_9CREN|nr:EVE domain-containing protein [Candidatus Acidianus copahuensis]EZQ02030.1 hypothetical protein CM19_11195 [Candidatus Acidianus copahuensis]NON62366.1 EVE domain-containing protein [Acidianus sp. RZ1]
MTYWLIPIQEDMWEVIKEKGIYGYKENLQQYIKNGDLLIIYISKYYAKTYGGKIVGVVKVTSDWFYDETPVFPEEIVRNKAIFPHRVKVEVENVGVCDFRDILDKINFIEDKLQMAKYLRNAPANLKRPIPEGDAKIIEECLLLHV